MSDDLARARALVDRELRQSSAGPGALGGEIVAALAAAGLLGGSDTEHDHGSLVHVLTHTPVGVPGRTLSGTEANDVADLVFGPVPGRVGSPAAVVDDDQDQDAETTEALRDAAAARVRVCLEWLTRQGEHGHAVVLDEAVHELEEIAARTGRSFSPSRRSSTTTPSTGIDTCRHRDSTGGGVPWEIGRSDFAPEE